MTSLNKVTAPPPSTGDLSTIARHILKYRWALIVLAAVAVAVVGLNLNWHWLVAVGIAPLLLSILPCAVMCGLGLCAHKLFSPAATTLSPQTDTDIADCCARNSNTADDAAKEAKK